MNPQFTIRPARPGDEAAVVALLYALAEYEKLTDRFHITEAIVRRDYLCERPLLECDLAFEGDRPVGVATWYWIYGSFTARRGIHLEDLFVLPVTRGKGYGKALLAHLAKRAVKAGGVFMNWDVLPWNTTAIEFYEQLGATVEKEWLMCRLAGEKLEDVADMARTA